MIEILLLNAFAIYRKVSFLRKRNERKKETEGKRERIKKKNGRRSRKKENETEKIYCVEISYRKK